MGKNPAVAVIVVIVLIVAVVLVVRHMTASDKVPRGSSTWYDTGTGKLYGVKDDQTPPMPAPSGKDGVGASVFARGSCENKADRFIGSLYKYTDKGKAELAEPPAEDPMAQQEKLARIAREEKLIKREGDAEWVVAGTEEGAAIMAETRVKGIRLCPTHLE